MAVRRQLQPLPKRQLPACWLGARSRSEDGWRGFGLALSSWPTLSSPGVLCPGVVVVLGLAVVVVRHDGACVAAREEERQPAGGVLRREDLLLCMDFWRNGRSGVACRFCRRRGPTLASGRGQAPRARVDSGRHDATGEKAHGFGLTLREQEQEQEFLEAGWARLDLLAERAERAARSRQSCSETTARVAKEHQGSRARRGSPPARQVALCSPRRRTEPAGGRRSRG